MKKSLFVMGIIPVFALTSCSLSTMIRKYEITNHEELTIPADDAEKIQISNTVGDIDIEYADVKDVQLVIDYTFSGGNEDKVYKLAETYHPTYEVNSGCLDIKFPSDLDKETNKGINTEADADMKLLIPESFTEFDISSNVGNINLTGLKGSFDLTESVGNINLNDIVITGDTSIMADVGDVNMTLKGVEKTNADISVNVGNVHIKNNNPEFEVQSEQKETTGEKKHFVVDGKCEFDVSVSVGKISLE